MCARVREKGLPTCLTRLGAEEKPLDRRMLAVVSSEFVEAPIDALLLVASPHTRVRCDAPAPRLLRALRSVDAADGRIAAARAFFGALL